MQKNKFIWSLLIILAIVISVSLYFHQSSKTYQVVDDNLVYSNIPEKPEYNFSLLYKNDSFDVYKISFHSRNFLTYPTIVYGLVFMPNKTGKMPGILFLPGGGGTKEGQKRLAGMLAEQGYAVMVIDQRGVGETGGYYLSLEEDYSVFSQGKEPVQHLVIYDALLSLNVLRILPNIDKNNIALAGESMGGRYALIASALDEKIKGVVVISASGFNIRKDSSVPYNSYLLSIDPDRYVSKISPRKLFMLQGTNDTVVPLSEAQRTFNLAHSPKYFYKAEDCGHGYCEAMHNTILEYFKKLFSS